MRSISSRVTCAITFALGALAATTQAADFAYVLSRGTTPVLRGYRIATSGVISSVLSISFPASTADNTTDDVPVLAYAAKQKVLLVGLSNVLMVYKVEANGLLTAAPTPQINYAGNRIGAVEVVEVGKKTFAYVGDQTGPSPGIYGFRVLGDGSVIALAGFPVATQSPVTDLTSNGKLLFGAQPSNDQVLNQIIAADGTLQFNGSGAPEFPCSQIQMSAKGDVLLGNASDASYLQEFEIFPPFSDIAFTGMRPSGRAKFTEPTRIAVGKKFVAIVRVENDAFENMRLFGIEKSGRTRIVNLQTSTSTMNSIDSIALIQNDDRLLAISETDDALQCFDTSTSKTLGSVNTTARDSESIPGLADLATMLAIQR
jgi:hypothetical protein